MAEQRLIDAIPFEKYLCDEAKTFNVMATNTSRYELLKALKYVVKANVLTEIGQKMMDTPTVDAVEVVRCKDCKYVMRDYHNSTGLKCDFEFHQRCVDGDWYCANGKRKDGENK